jgi:hypothetical protein
MLSDLHQKVLQHEKTIGAILGPLFESEIHSKVLPSLSVPNDNSLPMKMKILLVLLLSVQLVQADQFKVHYSLHGSGKDIIVNANSSDDARYTVESMFPGAVVTGVRRTGGK